MNGNFRPEGPYAVLMTPFDANGKIDVSALDTEIEFLCNSGISGIFPCATTGEFVSLSPEENAFVTKRTCEINKGRKKIVAGIASTNVDRVLALAKNAYECGCDGAVLCPPYFFTLSQNEIYKFYSEVLKKTDFIDIVLYNIPFFTNELGLDAAVRLMTENKNAVAMKDSSQNLKRISLLCDAARRERPEFGVFCGTDEIIVPALLAGCRGSMSAGATIMPELISKIYSLFAEGKLYEAQKLNETIFPLFRLADSVAFPAGYKLCFECRGMKMGNKQVVTLSEREYKDLFEKMKKEINTLSL